MRKKVIIDCDPGIDDSLAIMLALSMDELDLLGIVVTAGNSPVEMGMGNAGKVLRFMNRLDIPVFRGAERPLKRPFVNALDTHGPDGLGGSFLPEVPESEFIRQEKDAVIFYREVLRGQRPDTVSVISLGPMTTLARLIEQDPEAFGKIREIVSMGGCFRSHGNCTPVSEYNYWCDPDGAAAVYRETDRIGKMIHMVGLDVTRRIVLTPDLLTYMKRLDPEIGGFVEKITDFYMEFHWEWEHLIGCVINDPLAVAYFVDRALCSGFESYVQIETEGDLARGQSVVDSMDFYRHAPNAIVLTEVDTEGFFRLFLTKLLRLRETPDLLADLCRR